MPSFSISTLVLMAIFVILVLRLVSQVWGRQNQHDGRPPRHTLFPGMLFSEECLLAPIGGGGTIRQWAVLWQLWRTARLTGPYTYCFILRDSVTGFRETPSESL